MSPRLCVLTLSMFLSRFFSFCFSVFLSAFRCIRTLLDLPSIIVSVWSFMIEILLRWRSVLWHMKAYVVWQHCSYGWNDHYNHWQFCSRTSKMSRQWKQSVFIIYIIIIDTSLLCTHLLGQAHTDCLFISNNALQFERLLICMIVELSDKSILLPLFEFSGEFILTIKLRQSFLNYLFLFIWLF